MASMFRFGVLMVLLVMPFAFADVGPSPAAPKVTVHLVNNGQPDNSITEITYHCMGATETNPDNAVAPYPIKLACSGGNCTNGEWYYKFNPCFSFPAGYFSYDYGGTEVRTGTFNMSGSYDKYEMTIDTPTGQITSTIGGSCCFAGAILPAVLVGSVVLSSRSWKRWDSRKRK